MVHCSALTNILRLMIIFEKNWSSGAYLKNRPDGAFMESPQTGIWMRSSL